MIDGSVEHSHEQGDSCKMNPRFNGEYQMSDGETLFNKITLETSKLPTESNTNAAMLNEDLMTDLIKPSSTNTSWLTPVICKTFNAPQILSQATP